MARPTVWTAEKIHQFKAILRLNPTLVDCASFLEVSEDSIEKYCKKQGMSFAEFRSKHMVNTRFMLIRTAVKKAEQGDNCMLIFCLKNLCGWKDKHDIDHVEKLEINITEDDTNL